MIPFTGAAWLGLNPPKRAARRPVCAPASAQASQRAAALRRCVALDGETPPMAQLDRLFADGERIAPRRARVRNRRDAWPPATARPTVGDASSSATRCLPERRHWPLRFPRRRRNPVPPDQALVRPAGRNPRVPQPRLPRCGRAANRTKPRRRREGRQHAAARRNQRSRHIAFRHQRDATSAAPRLCILLYK